MTALAPLVDAAIERVLQPVVSAGASQSRLFNKTRDAFVRAVKTGNGATKRAALRGLYIAMPEPLCRSLPADAIAAYEAVLRAERDADTVVDAASLPQVVPGITVWQGDMSRLRVDAAVNPANNAMLGCFLPAHKCLDNILHGAAGPRLRIACEDKLQELGIEEDGNGNCRVTPGFELPATHVFHTVGPCLVDMQGRAPPRAPTPKDRHELTSCYVNCFETAKKMGLKNIAFCCISTGIFGYPAEEAAGIAISTVARLQGLARKQDEAVPHVVFNVFKDEDLAIYTELVPRIAETDASRDAAADE